MIAEVLTLTRTVINGQPLELLVPLRDDRPLLTGIRVVDVLQKTFQLEQVFKPDFVLDTKGLSDESANAGFALPVIEPVS